MLFELFAPRILILLSMLAIVVAALIHFYREGWRDGFKDATEARMWMEGGHYRDQG